MANPFTLSNGRAFKTQAAGIDHFRTIRDAYDDEARIVDPDHHTDLLALLERYDALILEGPPKSEGGVDFFFRRRNFNPERGPKWSSVGFWLKRLDGTCSDFSFIDAVKGQPKNNGREVYDACRNAVAAHLDICKNRHFERHADSDGRLPCEFSGTLVTRDEAHLDHAAPFFVDIVNDFRAEHGWDADLPSSVVTAPSDGQTTTTFVDKAMANSFARFHRNRARIRIIDQDSAPPLSERKPRTEIKLLVDLQ